MQAQYALTRAEYERELDVAIAGSFPASDPPPWTLGASSWMDLEAPVHPLPVPAAIDVVFDDRGFAGSRLAVLTEAMGMMAMVPVAILAAAVAMAAVVWGIVDAVSWLTGNS